jgi:RND family efflux transporter MFP subunit
MDNRTRFSFADFLAGKTGGVLNRHFARKPSGLTPAVKTVLLCRNVVMNPPKPTLDDLRIQRRAGSEPGSRNWLVIVAVIVLILLALGGWHFLPAKAIEVQTVAARETGGTGGDRTVLNASGYVTARRAATVSSKVTGKVTEVLIEEGMKVKEGQILARLDDTNTKANLEEAQAQLAAAQAALDETRAQLANAEKEFQRQTALAAQKIASASDLDTAEANLKALQAHLKQLESQIQVADRGVKIWQQQMDDNIIRAPFPGIVTTKDAQPGEMISPVSAGGGFTRTGIGTVVDMDSLEIEIDVNESYINRVQPGQPVEATLDAYADWKIPCKVIAIIPTADRQKSTVKVRVGFDKLDPRILPEMSVKVAFRETETGTAAARTVVIPKNSVRNQDGHDVVFVVQNGIAERRAITLGGAQGDDTTVSAGVSAGERVIVNSPEGLRDGVKVKEVQP